MTGKDLFQAMTQVEDELVTEAEEKEWDGRKKKAARPKKYWVTAAACLCVFAVSMAAKSHSRKIVSTVVSTKGPEPIM